MDKSVFGIIGFSRPCITLVYYSVCIVDHLQQGKINYLFTSSWIFFCFSFCCELETGFDLLPSKVMYKPPSSFVLMPGSIRLDNSLLKQMGTGKHG